MATFERKVMCNECPFHANALKGWLGPHSVDDIVITESCPASVTVNPIWFGEFFSSFFRIFSNE
jgi:hypothetical protein